MDFKSGAEKFSLYLMLPHLGTRIPHFLEHMLFCDVHMQKGK